MNLYFRCYSFTNNVTDSMKKLKSIDLFAGIGGMRLAFERACKDLNIEPDTTFYSEINNSCREVYNKNFKKTKAWTDIKLIPNKLINKKIPNHDILLAGFPCQPFSQAGVVKRNSLNKSHGFNDKNQGDLFFNILNIVNIKKPKAFLLENVKHLANYNEGKVLKKILSSLRKNYFVPDPKILNARDFCLAQKRERIFIVSVRNDVLDDIGMSFMCLSNVFPDPEEHQPTVRDAIGDIENDPDREELIQSMKNSSKGHWVYGFETHPDFPDSGPCLGLRGINDRSKVISIGDNIVGPWFQEQIKNGIIKPENEKHSYYMSRIVPWDQAAHSLTESGLMPKFMGGNHFHPEEYRIYTPTEAKRIMTLPEDYKLVGNIDEKQARIGLMVAPLCMKYLAEGIYEQILEPYRKISP